MSQDRGRDVSRELTEIRTVLSRAENAMLTLNSMSRSKFMDIDNREMHEALDKVIELLTPWKRTGKSIPKCREREQHGIPCDFREGHGGLHSYE